MQTKVLPKVDQVLESIREEEMDTRQTKLIKNNGTCKIEARIHQDSPKPQQGSLVNHNNENKNYNEKKKRKKLHGY